MNKRESGGVAVFTQTRELDPDTDSVIRVNGAIPAELLVAGIPADLLPQQSAGEGNE